MSPLGGSIAGTLRGDPRADRLVPRGVQFARSVAVLAAILAFFAVFALAVALAAGRLATTWNDDLAQGATLQIVAGADNTEEQARAALEVLRTTPGIDSVRMIEVAEQRELLEPWLGEDLALDRLPLPLLIGVQTEPALLNRESLELRLQAEAPDAVFDDHASWRAPLVVTAERLRIFAFAILGLIALAFLAILGLAAHAAIAASGETIQTLRLVGARDAYISGAFTRRFSRRALLGAAFGAAAAAAVLATLPTASEPGFFLVGIGLSGWHWLLPAIIPFAAGIVARLATAGAVRRQLRRWS